MVVDLCAQQLARCEGLWIGPYVTEVVGGDAGTASAYGWRVAMIAGTLSHMGHLDRMLGTRKWVALFGGNSDGCSDLPRIVAESRSSRAAIGSAVCALCSRAGFFGVSFPLMMAHGRAFVPAHLAGRGVTLMNLFGIGGVGLVAD